ncbi:putative reverse transcriptase domain-containing protein [Tanacetum coccineum]
MLKTHWESAKISATFTGIDKDMIEGELYNMRAWMFAIQQEMFRREAVEARPIESIDVLAVYEDARLSDSQGPLMNLLCMMAILLFYDVEITNGEIVSIDAVLRNCTLNLVNHPFKIDLLPIERGSFDVIIGMDWLSEHHAVIVCDDKIVRLPYNNMILIIEGDRNKSRLSIISSIKTRKYTKKGCQVFLAHVMENKSAEKQLEDVSIVRDFSEVFPEDLQGIPPTR